MRSVAPRRRESDDRLSFWLLAALMVILWIAGGASRADVSGQAFCRFFAWISLVLLVLFSPRLEWRRATPVLILLAFTVVLVFLQLVPLPPVIWTSFPGRELLESAANVIGQDQPWRPLSVSPSATANSLGSLVVPVAVFALCLNLSRQQLWRVAEIMLALVFAGCILALLQFSGAPFDNPLINYQAGSISGNLANRNHFALFVAIGCLIAPAWGFRRDEVWRAAIGMALLPFFLLVILATGSRVGLLLAMGAVGGSLFIVRANVTRMIRSLPRGIAIALSITAVVILGGAIILSFVLGRAIAIDRAFDLQAIKDVRIDALPYVVDAIWRYFPVGSGFGTFDAVYRIEEPDALLQWAYFNHAHNDWLEVILDGGLLAILLLAGALFWWGRSNWRIWRENRAEATLQKVGGMVLLLVMLASIVDYPARTPMIMTVVIIAAVWLHQGANSAAESEARQAREASFT